MKYSWIGEKVLVRTDSAGVFFGEIVEKDGSRVVLKNSRQLWRYQCLESIALSGVSKKGIIHDHSRICPIVKYREVSAIEILEVSEKCRESIETCEDTKQD